SSGKYFVEFEFNGRVMMTKHALNTVLHQIRRSVLPRELACRADGELLTCFVNQRDESAFEALLERHGPMVLGVCRRILRDQADPEVAFQAMFLGFVGKAASIRERRRVGNWL